MIKKISSIFVLTVIFVGFSFYIFNSNDEEIKVTESIEREPANKIVNVYVSGQVKTPAVVKLEDNGELKLVDAVNAAGGLTEFADTEIVNLAEPLVNGQHIHIPTKEIIFQEFADAEISTKTESNLVNINTADETELQKLYRVGPAMSKRIIEYRQQNGNFQTIEDIKKVRGIGEKTFEKIKDSITVQ